MTALAMLEKRLQWAREQGDQPKWEGGPTELEYAEKLLRETGSFVVEVKTFDDLNTLFSKVNDLRELSADDLPAGSHCKDSRYYQASLPEGYLAQCNIAKLDDLSDEQLESVRIVRAPCSKGLEMISSEIRPYSTKILSFITNQEGMLVTWYPGPFTARTQWEYTTVRGTAS